MNSKFKKVEKQLDKVVGGKGSLFGADPNAEGETKCTELCSTQCKDGFGNKRGSVVGTVIDKPVGPNPCTTIVNGKS